MRTGNTDASAGAVSNAGASVEQAAASQPQTPPAQASPSSRVGPQRLPKLDVSLQRPPSQVGSGQAFSVAFRVATPPIPARAASAYRGEFSWSGTPKDAGSALASLAPTTAQDLARLKTGTWRMALSVPRTGRDLSQCGGGPLHEAQGRALKSLVEDALVPGDDVSADYIKATLGLKHEGRVVSAEYSNLAMQLSRNERPALFSRPITHSSAILAAACFIAKEGRNAFDRNGQLKVDDCVEFLAAKLRMPAKQFKTYLNVNDLKGIKSTSSLHQPLHVVFAKNVSQRFPEASDHGAAGRPDDTMP